VFPLLVIVVALGACQPQVNESEAREFRTVDAGSAGFSEERLQHLTERMQDLVDKLPAPGYVGLILRNGQVVYEEALGYQTPDNDRPMSNDTIFRIYSMTKPVTSVAVMMLWEEGAFNLFDPVALYLPEFADVRVAVQNDAKTEIVDTVAPSRPITIQDLLRHTSGMTYGIFGSMTAVKQRYLDEDLQADSFEGDTAEWVRIVAAIPLEAHPGERWEYRPATTVLGRLVEVVSGQTFGDFLQERVFDPLGMDDTAFYIPAEKHDRMAQGVGLNMRGRFDELHDVSVKKPFEAGDSGLVSTARDYACFSQMMLNRGELFGVRLLSPKTVDLITSDHIHDGIDEGPRYLPGPGYGFGLGYSVRLEQGVLPVAGSPGDYGWGGLAGTYNWVDPREQLVAVLMVQDISNLFVYRAAFRSMVYAALDESWETTR